jgi:hypothetical protein
VQYQSFSLINDFDLGFCVCVFCPKMENGTSIYGMDHHKQRKGDGIHGRRWALQVSAKPGQLPILPLSKDFLRRSTSAVASSHR